MANLRKRAWCFTVNLPDDEDIEEIEQPIPNVEYMIWQYEEVNHRHIQGYVYFNNARAFNSVKKLIKDWAGGIQPHVEVAGGSPMQNEEYCSKEESRIAGTSVHKFGSMDGIVARVYSMLNDIVNRFA